MNKRKLCFLLFCVPLVVTATAQAPQLTITCFDAKVPVSGALETDSYAINNKGVITGDYIDSSGVQHGMTLAGKTLTTFDGPPGSFGIAAYGINNLGVVAGWYDDANGNSHGFMLANGTRTKVNFPRAISTQVNGINDNGWLVGTYFDSAGNGHGFYFNGKYHNVDVPGGSFTVAWAINDANLMTVYTTNSNGAFDAYTFDGTTFTLANVPGAASSVIHGINNNGDMNYTIFDSSGNRHGVLFQAGSFTQFDDPKGINATRADGLNDHLRQVGRYSPASGNPPNKGFKCNAS